MPIRNNVVAAKPGVATRIVERTNQTTVAATDAVFSQVGAADASNTVATTTPIKRSAT